MKTFDSLEKALKWVQKDVIEKAEENAVPVVADQIYKDSNEFTYRESGDMYGSGAAHSRFEDGLVIEHTPYARRRYYEGGTAGAGNKQAQPRWFEKTFQKYKEDYKTTLIKSINEAKKG